jgi:hypothetical protein
MLVWNRRPTGKYTKSVFPFLHLPFPTNDHVTKAGGGGGEDALEEEQTSPAEPMTLLLPDVSVYVFSVFK